MLLAFSNLDQGAYQQDFLHANPLALFFRNIGAFNAQFKSKIRLDGQFKTIKRLSSGGIDQECKRDVGFGGILKILIVILRHVCPNLRCLTLNSEEDFQNWERLEGDGIKRWEWKKDGRQNPARSDEERLEEVLAMITTGLGSLNRIQFWPLDSDVELATNENIKTSPLVWGKATRLKKLVKDRKPQSNKSSVIAIWHRSRNHHIGHGGSRRCARGSYTYGCSDDWRRVYGKRR